MCKLCFTDQQLPGVGILTKMSRPQVAAVVVFALCVSDNGLHTSNDRKRFLSFTRGENVDSMMRAVLHQLPLCIDCRIYLNFEGEQKTGIMEFRLKSCL